MHDSFVRFLRGNLLSCLALAYLAMPAPAAAQGYSTGFDNAPAGWQLTPPIGGVGWGMDATPAGFPSGVSRSGSSLNYNNGTDYAGTSSGSATSPVIGLPGLANPVLTFWDNYNTETRGTEWDRRRVQILSENGQTVLADFQTASVGYSFDPAGGLTGMGPGPCAEAHIDLETGVPVTAWHMHKIYLDPAWGMIRVRFVFDTVDDQRNAYAGWAIDDFSVASHAIAPPTGWPDLLPDTTTADGDGNELDDTQRLGGVLQFAWGASNTGTPDVHLIVGDDPRAQLGQSYLYFDAIHGHYHYSQYADFSVWQMSADGFTKIRRGPKRSFCLLDVNQVLAGALSTSPGCGAAYQQISYGWQDVYPRGTEGQEVDISGLATDTDYWLQGILDPLNRVRELDNGNQTDQIHFVLPASGPVAILDRGIPYPPTTAGLTITSAVNSSFQGRPALHVLGGGFDTSLAPVVYAAQNSAAEEAPFFTIVNSGEIWVYLPTPFGTPASLDLIKASGEVASARVQVPGVALLFIGATVSGGNGNGLVEPNECDELAVSVSNVGNITATGISATLSTSTPGVTVRQAVSAYPNIAPGATESNSTLFTLSAGSGLTCGADVRFNLIVSTGQGTFHLPFYVGSATLGSPLTFANNTEVAIPDLATAVSTMAVSGIATPLAKVTVKAYLTHTWDADLVIRLTGPDGTSTMLSNRRGSGGDNFGASCDAAPTVFDDEASSPIASGSAPFSGTFRPDEPLTAFRSKSGTSVNGSWTLSVQDAEGGDVGILRCWRLVVTPSECAAGGGPCEVPPDFALSLSPSSLSVVQGGGGVSSVTVFSQGSFSSAVDLGVSGLPNGVTASFSPNPASPPANGSIGSSLTLSASALADTGTLNVTLTGTSGAVTHSLPLTLTVAPAPQPDYGLSVSPGSATVSRGGSVGATITVSSLNAFASTVGLSASGFPSGVTASFTPSSASPPANGSANSTLTFTATAGAPTGTFPVTVSGASGANIRTTTLSLTVSPDAGAGDVIAVYDATLKAPKCAAVGRSCDSATLLNGRRTLGPEVNQPNTINSSCADGTSGAFHTDESNDRIKVSIPDGSVLAAGKTVRVDATVWADSNGSFGSDRLDLYHSVNASSPGWTLIATLAPSVGGSQVLSTTFTLPAGPLQAVRARFRYQGSASPCGTSAYDDHDDLVFAVGAAAPDFGVSLSPASLSLVQGAEGTSAVAIGSQNSFSSAVNLSVSGLPSGVTASFLPNPATPPANGSVDSTLTLTASSLAATGTFSVTVTGTSGSLTHSTLLTLTITAAPQPDFEIAISPTHVIVIPGGSGTSATTLTSVGGFASATALTVSGLPSGVTAAFLPNPVTPPPNGSVPSTLTLSASPTAANGSFTLTVTGTSGAVTRSTTLILTVPAPPQPDFGVSLSPNSVSVIQGGGGSATTTVSSLNGFSAPTALSISGLPPGVTATFSANPVMPPADGSVTATLTLTATATAMTGISAVMVTGTSGSIAHGATLTLTVSPPGPVTVFYDGAESATTSLVLTNTSSSTRWTRGNSSPFAGSYRFKAGSATGGNYRNNGDARMTTPTLSLADAASATLSYAFKYRTEVDRDFFEVRISTNGGTDWTDLVRVSGQSASYSAWAPLASINLSAYVGQTNVKIQFRFTSDASGTNFGAAVDEIKVVKQ